MQYTQKLFKNKNLTQKIALCSGALVASILLNKKTKLDSAQTAEQQVYSWGYGNFGQLGVGSEVTKFGPQEVQQMNGQKIKTLSAKRMVSAVLTEEGQLFTMGKNRFKVLGLESINTNIALPTYVSQLDGEKIEFVTVGINHMLAINDKGEVFTWGQQNNGKLGHSFEEEIRTPSKRRINTNNYLDAGVSPQKIAQLPENTKFVQGACGNSFTLLLSESGEVYSLGQAIYGQLGYDLENRNSNQIVPRKIDFFDGKKIKKISAGVDFCLALTEDGKLYSWGNNQYGQLGDGSNIARSKPQQIFCGGQKVKSISCGDLFVGAITDQGKIWAWGYGGDGQLGQKSKESIYSPQQVDFKQKAEKISCGGGHVAVISDKSDNNSLYMFGRGREGQLGQGDQLTSEAFYRTNPQKVVFFQNLFKVQEAKCGGDHTIALVEKKSNKK